MHTGMSKEEVLRLVESDIDGLPSKYPSDPERKGIKMPPEYLGKSGNFYTKHDNHVRMIGECVAVARDPSDGNRVCFCDINHKWWPRYAPHKARR